MGVSTDLCFYMLGAAYRTMYLLFFGVLHHLRKPTPLVVGSPEYMEVVKATLALRV